MDATPLLPGPPPPRKLSLLMRLHIEDDGSRLSDTFWTRLRISLKALLRSRGLRLVRLEPVGPQSTTGGKADVSGQRGSE